MARNDKLAAMTSAAAQFFNAVNTGKDPYAAYDRVLAAYKMMGEGLELQGRMKELAYKEKLLPLTEMETKANVRRTEALAGKEELELEKGKSSWQRLQKAIQDMETEGEMSPELIDLKKALLDYQKSKIGKEEAQAKFDAAKQAKLYESAAKAESAEAEETAAKSEFETGVMEQMKPADMVVEADLRREAAKEKVAGMVSERKLNDARAAAEAIKGGAQISGMDWMKQYMTLFEMRNKLWTEKAKLIDPLTYYIVKDDPEMTEYLQSALGSEQDKTMALRKIDDLMQGIGGILRQPPYNINLEAIAQWQRTTPATLEEQTQGGVLESAPAGQPQSTIPTDIETSDAVTMARQYGVDPYLAVAIAKWESGFNNNKRGMAGEYGIMQVMPGTGAEVGSSETDLQDPRKNFEAGIKYLKKLATVYGQESMEALIQSYNRGPGNKSREYLNGVMSIYNQYTSNEDLFNKDVARLNALIGGQAAPDVKAQMTPMPKRQPQETQSKAQPRPSTKGTTTEKYPSSEAMSLYATDEQPTPKIQAQPGTAETAKNLDSERKQIMTTLKHKQLTDMIIKMREDGMSYGDILGAAKNRQNNMKQKYGENVYILLEQILTTLSNNEKQKRVKR